LEENNVKGRWKQERKEGRKGRKMKGRVGGIVNEEDKEKERGM
jgi:hypothetical protein